MKKILLAFAVSVFAFSLSFAQDDGMTQDIQEPRGLASIWKSAEEAYATGDFAGAARHYESLVSSGASSPSLFYNLGNAYYRGGNIGKAVLNYERALKLDPSDADARHNLELARAHTLDKIDNVPEFILFSWIKNLKASLSSNTWAVISLVLLAAGIAFLQKVFFPQDLFHYRDDMLLDRLFLLDVLFLSCKAGQQHGHRDSCGEYRKRQELSFRRRKQHLCPSRGDQGQDSGKGSGLVPCGDIRRKTGMDQGFGYRSYLISDKYVFQKMDFCSSRPCGGCRRFMCPAG